MLKAETLHRGDDNLFPEPDGDIVQILEKSRGRLRVITRVEAPLPIDPAGLTVSDLEDELAEADLSEDEAERVIAAEEAGDDRTTAVAAIEEAVA